MKVCMSAMNKNELWTKKNKSNIEDIPAIILAKLLLVKECLVSIQCESIRSDVLCFLKLPAHRTMTIIMCKGPCMSIVMTGVSK